jgi:hypothetical protein
MTQPDSSLEEVRRGLHGGEERIEVSRQHANKSTKAP